MYTPCHCTTLACAKYVFHHKYTSMVKNDNAVCNIAQLIAYQQRAGFQVHWLVVGGQTRAKRFCLNKSLSTRHCGNKFKKWFPLAVG